MVVRLYCLAHSSCCNKKRLGVAEANVTYKRMQRHLYGSSSPRHACIQHVQMQQHVATAVWLYEMPAAGIISDQTPTCLITRFTSNNLLDAERSRGWRLCQCRDRRRRRMSPGPVRFHGNWRCSYVRLWGSTASRRPSPIKEKISTSRVRTTLGKKTCSQFASR
jgi:hypothetical protein